MMRNLWIALSICFMSMLSAAPLRIGWATNPLYDGHSKTQIWGQLYPRWNRDGVLDPLMATSLVIDNGEDCLVFLSIDVTSVSDFTDELLAEIKRIAPEVPQEKIICGATHTHTTGDMTKRALSPSFKDLGIEKNAFRLYAIKQIALTVKQAWNNRKAGGVGYGFGYAVVGHQRRAVFFNDRSQMPDASIGCLLTNGTGVMYANTNQPDFSHHEAGADPTLNLLFTFDENKKLTGAIVNIPCPSQCSENAWALSADYWHNIRLKLREKYGEDLMILPQCAAAGDISPHLRSYIAASKRKYQLKYGTTQEAYRDEWNRKEIAERVAMAFDEVYSWASKEIFTELSIENRRVSLDLSLFKPSEQEYKNAKLVLQKLPKPDVKAISAIENLKERIGAQTMISYYNRACRVIKKYEEYDTEAKYHTYMNVARLGNISFATNPFELYTDYMHRIQARAPFEQVFVIQLAIPGGGSYLGTERTMEHRGYGGVAASCNVSPEGGQQLVDETVRNLLEMWEGKNEKR